MTDVDDSKWTPEQKQCYREWKHAEQELKEAQDELKVKRQNVKDARANFDFAMLPTDPNDGGL